MNVPFTTDELNAAAGMWGCNCGPAALAFVAQVGLDLVWEAMPDFPARGYTTPTMMWQAAERLGLRLRRLRPGGDHDADVRRRPALVRIQWLGPWTASGANARWAYQYTHWIARFTNQHVPGAFVYDVNCGTISAVRWSETIVPLITGQIQRASGGWEVTHYWAAVGSSATAAKECLL